MTASGFLRPAARCAAAMMRAGIIVPVGCAAAAAQAAVVYDFNTEFSGGAASFAAAAGGRRIWFRGPDVQQITPWLSDRQNYVASAQ